MDEGLWEPVPMMQLLAYQAGKLVASGTQHTYEYHKPDPAHVIDQWSGL